MYPLALSLKENGVEFVFVSLGERRSDKYKITTAQLRKGTSLLHKFSLLVKSSDGLSGADYSVYLTYNRAQLETNLRKSSSEKE